MNLSVNERENFRKLVKNSDIFRNHFVNTGYTCRTVYNTINKATSANPIKDKKRTGRPSS